MSDDGLRSPAPKARHLKRTEQAIRPWKNGGGRTRELCTLPLGSDFAAFDWRLSVASIEVSGPFSSFPGVERTLVLLRGSSLELVVDGVSHTLSMPGDALRFSGDASVVGQLHAGGVEALNVMSRGGEHLVDVHMASDETVSGVVVGLDVPCVAGDATLHYGDALFGEEIAVAGTAMLVCVTRRA